MTSTSNYLGNEDFQAQMEDVCTRIYDVLAHHCGPRALNALVIQHDERSMRKYTNVFTKDGIDIVNSLEFDSLMETHIKNAIAYVGERVDNAAHDGTTTSMMFVADLLRTLPPKMMHLTGAESGLILKKCLDRIEKILAENTITLDDLRDKFGISLEQAKDFIVYNEAMIASKRDVEIAEAITEVVRHQPPELFGQFNLSQNPLETDRRLTVLYDDFDFPINVTMNVDFRNHALQTEYLCEDCDLLITDNQLIPGNPDYPRIVEWISDLDFDKETLERPLLLVAPNLDSRLYTGISLYNEKHSIKIIPTSLISLTKQQGKSQMLIALLNSAGKYRMETYKDFRDAIIRHAKVHVKGNFMYVSNIYEKDGTMYHPYFKDPEAFPPYTQQVKELQETLRSYIHGHLRDSAPDDKLISEWIEVLRRLICQRICRLQISGTTHDSMHDFSVVKDAFGAVLSALEKGFVLDGFWTIFSTLHTELGDALYKKRWLFGQSEKEISVISSYEDAMIDIYHVIRRLLTKIHNVEPKRIEPCKEELKFSFFPYPQKAEHTLDHGAMTIMGVNTGLEVYRTDTRSRVSTSPLIQPRDGFNELLKRVRELLPKFATTVCCITPGTLHDSE